ncbi:MAG: tetratricopeptide repeat protein, partial [Cyanobacteria bacterium SZAS LIN-2]|nr:tetratricopeptide repeat protein [Cyanobacteria bacterium SZAS LIN-2]
KAFIALALLLLVIGLALGGDKLGLSTQHWVGQEWIEAARKQNEERMQEHLKKILGEFETAELNRGVNPSTYCEKLLDLAYAYRAVKEDSKADPLFEEAMTLYTQSPAVAKNSPRLYDSLCRYTVSCSTPEQFESRFTDLIEAGERNKIGEATDRDRVISDTVRYFGDRAKNSLDTKKQWRKVIDMRASVYGKDAPVLAPPLRNYADACEAAGDINEAEKSLLRAMAVEDKSDKASAVIWQVRVAEFYLRNNMPEKAEPAWCKAKLMTNAAAGEWEAREFMDLSDQYKRAGRNADMEKIITAMLAIGGDNVVKAFDPKIDELVSGYIASGSLDKAENLLKQRVGASSRCSADVDSKDWRIKLSNLYLATGRAGESNKIYQDVLSSAALAGQATDAIRKNRADLLARLGKTDEANAIRAKLPVPMTGPIKIEYGLLAMEEIRLGHGVQINSYVSTDRNGTGTMALGPGHSEGRICCLGTTRHENGLQMSGTIYGKVLPALPETLNNPIFQCRLSPAPNMATPFPQALKPPGSGTFKWPPQYGSSSGGGAQQLVPGDYVASKIPPLSYATIVQGRTRFFLEDNGDDHQDIEV